jgi:pimeloyl-ACP methyl ester carboxylesterase
MERMAVAMQHKDGWWQSSDGLRLHFRDYAGPKDRLPVLCIPGLTRNARDFEHVAERIAGAHRVICVELRGRGESAFAVDPQSYNPLDYLNDLEELLTQLKLKKFIAVGTSLGGILTMLLAASKPGRVAGALINDIGPVIEPAGLDRIKSQVGRAQSWLTWVHAARDLGELQRDIYPDYNLVQWIALAKRLFKLNQNGRIVPDYDARIAEPMRGETAPAADLWPAWDALGNIPVTVLRGGLSDILSAKTARDMVKRLPNAKLVTISNVGHAPALDEAASLRAIDGLLKSVDEG